MGGMGGEGGGVVTAERIRRSVLPGVHAWSPLEEEILHSWLGGLGCPRWVWGGEGGFKKNRPHVCVWGGGCLHRGPARVTRAKCDDPRAGLHRRRRTGWGMGWGVPERLRARRWALPGVRRCAPFEGGGSSTRGWGGGAGMY